MVLSDTHGPFLSYSFKEFKNSFLLRSIGNKLKLHKETLTLYQQTQTCTDN